MNWWELLQPPPFDPEGSGYDYRSALAAGMRPDRGGHWGSVREAREAGVPPGSYLMLKGHGHPTWNLGMEAELERGFDIRKILDRYWSVPR